MEAKQREDELQTHVKALESAQNYPIDPFALQKAIDKAAHDDVPVEYIDMARDVLQKAKEVKEDLKAALKPKGPPSKTKMLMCMAQAKDELDQIADGEVRMLLEEGELKVKEIDAASEALTTCLKEPPVDEPPWDQKKYDFGTEAYEELATQIISGIQDIEGALEKARDAGIDEESKEMRAVEDMLIRWKELKPRTLMVDTELARVSHDLDGDTSLTTPRPDAPTKLEPGSPTKSDGGSPKSPKFGGRSRKTKEKSFLFWFVRAAKLREMSGQMPKLQELQEREEKEGKGSWLCQIPITEEDAFTNKYAQTILTVSQYGAEREPLPGRGARGLSDRPLIACCAAAGRTMLTPIKARIRSRRSASTSSRTRPLSMCGSTISACTRARAPRSRRPSSKTCYRTVRRRRHERRRYAGARARPADARLLGGSSRSQPALSRHVGARPRGQSVFGALLDAIRAVAVLPKVHCAWRGRLAETGAALHDQQDVQYERRHRC